MYGHDPSIHATINFTSGIFVSPDRQAVVSGTMGIAHDNRIMTNPCLWNVCSIPTRLSLSFTILFSIPRPQVLLITCPQMPARVIPVAAAIAPPPKPRKYLARMHTVRVGIAINRSSNRTRRRSMQHRASLPRSLPQSVPLYHRR